MNNGSDPLICIFIIFPSIHNLSKEISLAFLHDEHLFIGRYQH